MSEASGSTAEELDNKSRKELQALCKQLGLKASGKNTDLIESLKAKLVTGEATRGQEDEREVVDPRPIIQQSIDPRSISAPLPPPPPPPPPPTNTPAAVLPTSKWRQLNVMDTRKRQVRRIEYNIDSSDVVNEVKETVRAIFNITEQHFMTHQADFYFEIEDTEEVFVLSASFLKTYCDGSHTYLLHTSPATGLKCLPKSFIYDMVTLVLILIMLHLSLDPLTKKLISRDMGEIFFGIWYTTTSLGCTFAINVISAISYWYLLFSTARMFSFYRLLRHYLCINYWTDRHVWMRRDIRERLRCIRKREWKRLFSFSMSVHTVPPPNPLTSTMRCMYEDEEATRWFKYIVHNGTDPSTVLDHIKNGMRKVGGIKKPENKDPDYTLSVSDIEHFSISKEFITIEAHKHPDYLLCPPGKGFARAAWGNYMKSYSGTVLPPVFLAVSFVVISMNNKQAFLGRIFRHVCLLVPLLSIVNSMLEIGLYLHHSGLRKHIFILPLITFPEPFWDFGIYFHSVAGPYVTSGLLVAGLLTTVMLSASGTGTGVAGTWLFVFTVFVLRYIVKDAFDYPVLLETWDWWRATLVSITGALIIMGVTLVYIGLIYILPKEIAGKVILGGKYFLSFVTLMILLAINIYFW